MKNIFVLLLAAGLVSGCGSKDKPESKFQGVTPQKDYIAEGMRYLNASNVNDAIKSFDNAIKQDPNNPINYIILGQVYMRLSQPDRAVDSFSAAVRVDPQNGEAYYLLAVCQGLKGSKKDAIISAQRSVEIFMKGRNEEKFKQAALLLRSLTESGQAQNNAGVSQAQK